MDITKKMLTEELKKVTDSLKQAEAMVHQLVGRKSVIENFLKQIDLPEEPKKDA